MSSLSNGHLPEGAQLATLEILRAANRTHVKAARLSERVGSDVYVLIRAIRRLAYLQMLPPIPKDAGADTWPTDPAGNAKAFQAWLESLPDADRLERQRQWDDVTYKVLRAGMIDPAPTDEALADFGDDADAIATEILTFSGLVKSERPAEPASA